ncbi:MAG: hypothetical protein ABII27_02755 [bacterium]
MHKWFFLLVFGVLLLQIGCGSGIRTNVKKGEIKNTIEGESIQKKFIETIGIGAADQGLENATQRKATSRNAAIVAAQYEMISTIKGIALEGGVTIEKAMETDSKITATVNDTVKSAQIIKTEWTDDDGCVVTLRVSKKDLEEKMGMKFE